MTEIRIIPDEDGHNQCLFCWKVLEQNKDNPDPDCIEKIYISCSRHLNKDVMGKDRSISLKTVCSMCLVFAQTLSDINSRLEAIEKEVADFVKFFTSTALNLRKENKPKAVVVNMDLGDSEQEVTQSSSIMMDAESIFVHEEPSSAENSPNEFIHIKSETSQNYEPEEVTDYFAYDEESEEQLEFSDPLSICNIGTSVSSEVDSVPEVTENRPTVNNELSLSNDKSPPLDSGIPDVPAGNDDDDDDVEIIYNSSAQSISTTPVSSQKEDTHEITTSYTESLLCPRFSETHPDIAQTELSWTDIPFSENIYGTTGRINVPSYLCENELESSVNNVANPQGQDIIRNNKCNICNKIFPTEQTAFLHLQLYHKLIIPPHPDGLNAPRSFLSDGFSAQPCGIPNVTVPNCIKCNFCLSVVSSPREMYFHQKICFPQNINKIHRERMTFSCERCPSSFPSMADLKIHCSSFHGIPIHCEMCKMIFTDLFQLETHKITRHETTYCRSCHIAFPTISHLEAHNEQIHLLPISPSYMRVNSINSSVSLPHNTHIGPLLLNNNSTHRDVPILSIVVPDPSRGPPFKPFKCLLCFMEFDKIEYLTAHKSVHPQTNGVVYRLYVCEICGMSFTSIMDQLAHTETHSTAKITVATSSFQFKCASCELSFSSNFELTKHQIVHVAQRKYFCQRCYTSFYSENELMLHNEQCHSENDQPFKCLACGVCFPSVTNLIDHMKTNSADGQMQFKCCVCNEKFRTKIECTSHQNVHVEDKTRFYCSVCNLTFANELECSFHNGRYHSGAGNATNVNSNTSYSGGASSSSLSFPIGGNIEAHQANSQNNNSIQTSKLFSGCNICKIQFSATTNVKCHYRLCSKLQRVKNHLKYFDKNVNRSSFDLCLKYKCSECHKGFNYLPSLKFHNLTHKNKTD